MSRMLRTYLACLALLAAGCSSNSGAAGTTAAQAVEMCRETVDTFCSRNSDCSAEVGEIQASQKAEYVANCKAGASTTLDCSRVGHVTGHPDACAMDLIAMPCSFYVKPTGLPLPASCRNLYAP